MSEQVSCDDLARLVGTHPDRVAVLILLRDVEGKPGGSIQFVTWGRTAEDKAEAHDLKEWIKDEVFDGEVPEAKTHESFILDAAKNKQEADRLRQQCDQLLAAAKAARAFGSQGDTHEGISVSWLLDDAIRNAKDS